MQMLLIEKAGLKEVLMKAKKILKRDDIVF
jgi:hypothetical protein